MELTHETGKLLSTNITQLSADLASFYNTDVESAFEALNAIFTGHIRTLRQYGLNISEANLENYRLSRGIKTAYSSMSEQQKILLRYNYVMENTKDIQGDFAKTQASFANQTKLLQQNFKTLSATLGSFLIPVLSTVLKYLNAIITAVNALFSRLASVLGIQIQTFGGAGVALNDIQDGWDGATGAAEKYRATIAGFDELETLNPKSSGGGAGAGGSLTGEDLFPNGLLSYDVEDNVEALDVSFNKLIKLIDDKIQQVKSKSEELSSAFGRNVNGLVNYVNWPLLGKTVGDGFNLITSAVNRFMEEIDFKNLGSKFAEAVNGIFETVSFEEVGHNFSLKFNAIIDSLRGFVETFSFSTLADGILTSFRTALAEIRWEDAGVTLAAGFNKVFGFLDDLLNGRIIADLGGKIAVAINAAVANIDAAQIGRVANGFATQIIEAVKQIDWNQIGNKLNEAFKESNIIGNLVEAVKEIIAIKINVKGGIFGGLFNLPPGLGKTLFAIAAAIGAIGTAAIAGIGIFGNFAVKLIALRIALSAVSVVLTGLNSGLKFGAATSGIGALVKDLATGKEELWSFGTVLKDVGSNIATRLGQIFSGIGQAFLHPLAAIKTLGASLSGLFSSIGAFIAANPATLIIAGIALVVAAIATLWKNSEEFRNFVKDTWENHLKPVLDKIGADLRDLYENHIKPFWEEDLKPLIELLWGGIKSVWNDISELIGSIIQKISPVFTGIVKLLGAWFGNITQIIGGVIDIFGGLIKFITGIFSGNWKQAWEGIVKVFKGIWESIVGIVKVPVNGVIALINGMLSGITSGINRVINWANGFKAPDWIPGIGGKGINLPTIQALQIPYLAAGAVIDSPTIAMMGEYANARSNPEIVAPEAKIAALLDSSNETALGAIIPLMRQMINAIDEKDLSVSIGDDTIAAAAQRGNKNYQRRTGQPLFSY